MGYHVDRVLHTERQIKFSSTDIIEIVSLLPEVDGDEGVRGLFCFRRATADRRARSHRPHVEFKCSRFFDTASASIHNYFSKTPHRGSKLLNTKSFQMYPYNSLLFFIHVK